MDREFGARALNPELNRSLATPLVSRYPDGIRGWNRSHQHPVPCSPPIPLHFTAFQFQAINNRGHRLSSLDRASSQHQVNKGVYGQVIHSRTIGSETDASTRIRNQKQCMLNNDIISDPDSCLFGTSNKQSVIQVLDRRLFPQTGRTGAVPAHHSDVLSIRIIALEVHSGHPTPPPIRGASRHAPPRGHAILLRQSIAALRRPSLVQYLV